MHRRKIYRLDPHEPNETRSEIQSLISGITQTFARCFGPYGLDILYVTSTGQIIVTSDVGSLISRMEFKHPVAKILQDFAEHLEANGSSVKTALVFTSALLSEGKHLCEKGLHPSVISEAYLECASRIEQLSKDSIFFQPGNIESLVATNLQSARGASERLGKLLVDGYERIEHTEQGIDRLSIISVAGQSLTDSQLLQGVLLEKKPAGSRRLASRRLNCRILTLNSPIEYIPKMRRISGSITVGISSVEQMQHMQDFELEDFREIARTICSAGIEFVFCSKAINRYLREELERSDVLVISDVPAKQLELISASCASEIGADWMHIDTSISGIAREINLLKFEPSRTFIQVIGEKNRVETLLLRGSTEEALHEAERLMKKCWKQSIQFALDGGRIVAGGGAFELILTRKFEQAALSISGRQQLVYQAFARALQEVCKALVINSGANVIDTMLELKALHSIGESKACYSARTNSVMRNAIEEGIIDSAFAKMNAISLGAELASFLIRVDARLAVPKSLGSEARKKYAEELDYDSKAA